MRVASPRCLLWLCALTLGLPWAAAPARADQRWDRWQVLLWQDRTPAQLQGLPSLGFTGTKLRATNGVVDLPARANRLGLGLPYYLENIATDFYAPYHRYTPGRSVTWLFDEARARHRADPDDPSVLLRDPGLSDPAWLDTIRQRLDRLAWAEQPNHPLFYNLADESGIADLAAAWDFDLSPTSLAGFRLWLQHQYRDLDALNAQWGTQFAAWNDVRPERTDAAIARADDNFSAWSDFKAWMDVSFARAVRAGTDALHAADPAALSALEGGQVPGWGGYDYALLAPSVDVMEIYEFGEALDLALAFNPTLIPLRTSFGTGPRETHAAWRNVLHGGRGMIVWDEADDVVGQDGMAGPRGLEIAALTRAIDPVASILNQARPDPDPVAILHSQASFRLRWLLDRRAGDHDWTARDAEREYDDNAWRMSRRLLVRRLAELGVQPRFVSGATIEQGALRDVKVLFLPHAIALSDSEVAAIAELRARGGTVVADTEPGLYDGHGRRRRMPPLPDIPTPQAIRPDGEEPAPAMQSALAALLRDAGAAPRIRLAGPDRRPASGVEVRWFRHPRGLVMALQAGRPWGGPDTLAVRLPQRAAVSDLRAGGAATVTDRVEVTLDGVEPTVLLLAPPP